MKRNSDPHGGGQPEDLVGSRCFVGALFGLISCAIAPAQDVWRVSASALPGGDGLSWTSAFSDLQDALDAARAQPLFVSQQIWIAPGTYRPDRGTELRASAFIIDRPMELLGGFTGTELSTSERLSSTPMPVLSGDLGIPATRADNALHVVIVRDETAESRLERLIVRDGNANDAIVAFGRLGGGVLIEDGAPTIDGCLITACTARDGAGVYADSGEPTISGTMISQNVATTSGGGAYLKDGGHVIGSIFDSNNGPSGAGLFVCCGGGEIRDSLFQGNFGNNGGGIFFGVGAPQIARCTFISNSATRGAGIYASRSGGTIASCRFASNTASDGGGVYIDLGVTLVNCLFTRNTAFSFGGAIYARNNPAIIGCTIYSNAAGFSGGGVHHASGTTTLANSILWANTDSTGITEQAQVAQLSGAIAPGACCIESWSGSLGGALNTGTAPGLLWIAGTDGLLGTADDDPRVAAGSVCIDAGINGLWPADAADLDLDGDTLEITPLDAFGVARALDDDSVPDTGMPGAGLPAIADIGCAEALPGCVGDINGDLWVNAADFTVLAANFGTAGAQPWQGDINRDSIVNAADFTMLAAQFGTQCP